MWTIYEHKTVKRKLLRLPTEILKRYEKWKEIVTVSGPSGLSEIKGFRDEGFVGNWFGYRSSRLGLQYRVIYYVEREEMLIKVIDVTGHDYRRK